jgi:hypothetical protein
MQIPSHAVSKFLVYLTAVEIVGNSVPLETYMVLIFDLDTIRGAWHDKSKLNQAKARNQYPTLSAILMMGHL